MRPLPNTIVPELLGPHGGVQVFFQAHAHVVALRVLAANDQAEAHGFPPWLGAP